MDCVHDWPPNSERMNCCNKNMAVLPPTSASWCLQNQDGFELSLSSTFTAPCPHSGKGCTSVVCRCGWILQYSHINLLMVLKLSQPECARSLEPLNASHQCWCVSWSCRKKRWSVAPWNALVELCMWEMVWVTKGSGSCVDYCTDVSVLLLGWIQNVRYAVCQGKVCHVPVWDVPMWGMPCASGGVGMNTGCEVCCMPG